MAKEHKYKFDPHSLTLKKETRFSKITKVALPQIVSIVIVAFIVFYSLSFFFDTPQERNLKYQNKLLKEQYQNLLKSYQQNEKNLEILEEYNKSLYKLVLGTSYLPFDDESPSIDKITKINPKRLNKQNAKRLKNLLQYMATSKKQLEDFKTNIEKYEKKSRNIPSILPLPISSTTTLYGFGIRLDPIYKTPFVHKGIDFNADFNTPVFATADGTVKTADVSRLNGNMIVIDHGNGYETHYYHLDQIFVRQGQNVKKGQKIGLVGTTGKSLVSHLHYEIHFKGKPINPIFFFFTNISPDQYFDIYKKASIPGISLD